MIVANVANSGNDEFYTPDYAIDPIMKYIPEECNRIPAALSKRNPRR